MPREIVNVMIGGEAGQGLATVGQVLAKSLVRGGWHIVMLQDYQSRIRGGHNTMSIRASRHPILAPAEAVDLLVALNAETVSLHQGELAPEALVLVGSDIDCPEAACLKIPYGDLAEGKFANTAALGVAACQLGLDLELVDGVLQQAFGKKDPEVGKKNRAALEKAYEWSAKQETQFGAMAPAEEGPKRVLMGGNEAMALGAMSAGVKFCAFYPMTPSTSVALTLIAHAPRMGIAVEQAEDEIAALNMAIGASFAGAPAIVPTSGGGFALMTEALSLAAMTETPVVLALIQRPGPATGLPTRTEQGDLEFALSAGHGEFARALFTPGDPEEAFWLARQAFYQAERFQTPVIILGDQFLADSLRAVEPFDVRELETAKAMLMPDAQPAGSYDRYALTPTGISPRIAPGLTKRLVVADSDEHTPDGHITEDLSVRVEMVDKRLKKLDGMRGEFTPPLFDGPEVAELLLVGWGSTKGAIAEAAAALRDRGRAVATCHFRQVWPLDPAAFLERMGQASETVMVESNATGQLARLIRRETGFKFTRTISRYDGWAMTPQYILRALGVEI